MYLHRNPTYYRGTQQIALRAPFLLLMNKTSDTGMRPQLYAVIRRVALRQLGHWMMGSANIGGHWHTISGAYGNDGLPMDVEVLPRDAIPLPDDLATAFWEGGGHNCAGREWPALREWALHIPEILEGRNSPYSDSPYSNDRRAA